MNEKIKVFMPGGEGRAEKVRQAIERDKVQRFAWAGPSSEIPGDIQFINTRMDGLAALFGSSVPTQFNIELKDFTGKGDDNSDLLASIQNGHLYEQTLKLRRAGHPCAIVVLGNEEDLTNAILSSVTSRGYRGEKATDLMVTYERMVFDFEANCRGQNIGFWWLKKTPYKRILSNVHKILTESDLSQYAPKPLAGEEKTVGLSIIAGDGIGSAKAKSILEKFDLALVPKERDTFLDDCSGIGPKLAQSVGKALNLPLGTILRPKVKKARAKATTNPKKVRA